MKLKDHIEKFDESMEESLGESPKPFAVDDDAMGSEIPDLFASVEQLECVIQDKDTIIESLKNRIIKLMNQVSMVEDEKSTILEELKKSGWLENKVTLSTKYKGKLKTILGEIKVVDSKIVPILTAVARRKQGIQQLTFSNWLKIPENRYLFQINEDIAKEVFGETKKRIEERRFENESVRGGGVETPKFASNYSLKFTGPANNNTDGPYVSTTFDPQAYSLNEGFTVSYWVKPDELGTHMFALGRRHGSLTSQRFTFGLNTSTRAYFGVGNTKKTGYDHGMSTGIWYHWVITYAGNDNGKYLKAYRDGEEIMDTTTTWSATDDDTPMYMGARNVKDIGYNNGWDCSLDEIAIFDEVKDVSTLYNSGTPSDLSGESGLVGYWRFEEGSGTTATDLSGNGNHGTLTTEDAGLPTWTTDTP